MIKGLSSLILNGLLWRTGSVRLLCTGSVHRELEAVPFPLLSAGTATLTASGEANVNSDFALGDTGTVSLDAGAASLLSTGSVLPTAA